MAITVEATYENGTLKLAQSLPLREHERVRVSINTPAEVEKSLQAVERGYGLIRWTGSVEELDSLIEDVENDPLEGP